MPSVTTNKDKWNQYDWSQEGDEWSVAYGSSTTQWFGALLPRIQPFVPAPTIVEIAPGHGRWTRFLADYCDRLIGVDLSDVCVAACRRRFADDPRLSFYVNDGRSLECVPDYSADLVFSFDSLVHADGEAIDAYAREISSKLTNDGIAFLHHSNLGEYSDYFRWVNRLPRGRGLLHRWGIIDVNRHWRGDMSAEAMRRMASSAGLVCASQELFAVEGMRHLSDCISVLARPGSRWDKAMRVYRNHHFMEQAAHLKQLAECYGGSSSAVNTSAGTRRSEAK